MRSTQRAARPTPGARPLLRAWLACAVLAACTVACSADDGADEPAADTTDAGVGADAAGSAGDAVAGDAATADGADPADAAEPADAGDPADVVGADDAATVDDADGAVGDPCAPGAVGQTWQVALPLGETLFFDGDDYLAAWGVDHPCAVALDAKPAGATATILGGQRLTPDLPGDWVLTRGGDTVTVHVIEDFLSSDTFLNYNYTPTAPLALVPGADAAASTLWVASPPSNAVQQVTLTADGATNAKLVRTGAWPTSLAVWPGTPYLLVTQTGRDTLGFLDTSVGRIVDAVRLGNEPYRVVVDTTGPAPVAYVVLFGEDRIVRLDLETREVTGSVALSHKPRALAFDAAAGRLYVASLLSGNAHPQGPVQEAPIPAEEEHDVAILDTSTTVDEGGSPTQAFALLGWAHRVSTITRGLFVNPGDGGRLVAAVTHSQNTALQVDADTRPHVHALEVVDLANAATDAEGLLDAKVVTSVDLDMQPSSTGPAASPFSMALTPDAQTLVVTLSAGRGLLYLDPATYAELGRVQTGNDPRGLAFAHGRVWTYAWLDNQLEGHSLPGAATAVAPVVLTVGADPTPPDVKEGQRMFNDAAFSKKGDFSCNNCHVDGLTDGLVWDLLLDGPVNTLAFRNVGGTDPFLWGGQLPTLFDFSREVLKLVGANATGAQMELITRYMQSVTAPPNPYALPGGRFSEQAKHGKAVFDAYPTGDPAAPGGAGCAACHSAPFFTNGELVDGKTPKKTDVPSLLGTYDTGPWGREAQWTTLGAMVDFALEYTGAQLSSADRDDLLAFVQELPGDLLYVTSALPLNNAEHVWHETPIELQFNDLLAPAQESHFSLELIDDDSGAASPVAGAWQVSGRYARFVPDAPKLALQTHYRVVITADVEGRFGQKLAKAKTVDFWTGDIPAFDVSGKWSLKGCEPQFGCANVTVAFLQATGGKITGVLVSDVSEAAVDNVQGVVSADKMVLEPFVIQTDFIGEFFIKDPTTHTMVDTNSDGFADEGSGYYEVEFIGQKFGVNLTWKRNSLPDGVGAGG